MRIPPEKSKKFLSRFMGQFKSQDSNLSKYRDQYLNV